MVFDWTQFLEARAISYVTRGPNVEGHGSGIAVACPFCGNADPSEHMSINLNGRGWVCRRNRDHRGRDAAPLVQALLKCSRAQADIIVHGAPRISNDFESQLLAMMKGPEPDQAPVIQPLPTEFKPFADYPSQRPFLNYLLNRRFPRDQLPGRLRALDIHYCVDGEFDNRIIFPVRALGGYLAWTGRTISQINPLRYKTEGPIGASLPWLKKLLNISRRCDAIVLVEGPFDALKINLLGYGLVCSTCFFTNTPSRAQLDQLYQLLPRFKRRYLMLDQDMVPKAMALASQLSSLEVQVKLLPSNRKDPAEIRDRAELEEILR